MRKCVETGNEDVAEYVRNIYKGNHNLIEDYISVSWEHHLLVPMPQIVFEIVEPLEYPDYSNKSFKVLQPGIYRIEDHIGWIWDTEYPIIIEKYQDGNWTERKSIDIAIDDTDFMFMIDWRGTRPVSIQYDLPL